MTTIEQQPREVTVNPNEELIGYLRHHHEESWNEYCEIVTDARKLWGRSLPSHNTLNGISEQAFRALLREICWGREDGIIPFTGPLSMLHTISIESLEIMAVKR
ncbi:MAG: hypothetical protein F6K65_22270 [Moorea sp. SIO3C2]|nr:hypothetical protein [Moorena sp. SIO3C2]